MATKKKKQIILGTADGMIYVIDNPSDYKVIVRDYDIDGADEDVLKTDEDGDKYHEMRLR